MAQDDDEEPRKPTITADQSKKAMVMEPSAWMGSRHSEMPDDSDLYVDPRSRALHQ